MSRSPNAAIVAGAVPAAPPQPQVILLVLRRPSVHRPPRRGCDVVLTRPRPRLADEPGRRRRVEWWMSWRARHLVAVALVPVASTAGIVSGCSLSNSSTARSTPTPASDQPYPTPPTPTPPTPTPTGPTPTGPTPTERTPTGSPTPTPTPTPKRPEPAALVLYGYLDSIARTGDGYTVSYRPATRCLAVKAPTCKSRPDDVFADGRLMIHQSSVPALPGNEGFKTKEDATKVALLVIEKIRKGETPPTISIDEMKTLSVIK